MPQRHSDLEGEKYLRTHPGYREIDVQDYSGGSLKLRRHSLAFAQSSLDWVNDPDVRQFMGADFSHVSLQTELKRIREILANKDEYHWAIDYKGIIIGSVTLHDIREQSKQCRCKAASLTVLIGYPNARKKGIASASMRAVLAWAFEEGGFEMVTARALRENVASIRTLEKLGFLPNGTEPYDGLVNGKRSEWKVFTMGKRPMLSEQEKKDVAKIYGTTPKMATVIVEAFKDYLLPPYRDWDDVLRIVSLDSHSRVLDLACGNGRTAVDIAKRFGSHVTGIDVVPPFIASAKNHAEQEGVADCCTFQCMDARKAKEQSHDFDLILWLSAPHLWGGLDKAMKAQRKCVRNGGLIVIYDAYYLPKARRKRDTWYRMEETTKKLERWGDRLIRVIDEGNTEWKAAYAEERNVYNRYLRRSHDPAAVSLVRKRIKQLDKMERWETAHFGTAFWIVEVRR